VRNCLDDHEPEEVWINDPSQVFVPRHGRRELTNLVLADHMRGSQKT
jgi:pilus assembly protein CpaF